MRTVRLLALFLLSNQAVAQPLVVLDPGHGGQDPGAVGCGLEEKDVVLDVGRRLDGLLQAAGLRTAMTRADDRFIELRARAAFANDRGATLFVSMHANANAGQPATGTETWIARAASNTSNQLAGRLQRELVAEWGLRDRGVKREDFSVLVNTSMPAALTEMAFINRCDPDAALLGNADARQRIAAAHARAITGQLGVDAPPAQNTGTLRGVVFEDRGAGLDDTSARLGGARVVVTGAEARSAADTGAWTFQIAPGDQRVTVSLAGFREGSRTCLVQAGAETWCSVGLVRNPEVPPEDPDVGVPPETPADQGVIDQGVVADQGPPTDAEVRPPQETFDLGATDFGAPPESPDPARRRDAFMGVDAWPEAPAASEPSGAFCQVPVGYRSSGGWALLMIALLALRRRWLLVLVPTIAHAHVPDWVPGGQEAIESAGLGDQVLTDEVRLSAGMWREAVLSPTGRHVLLIHRDGRTLAVMETRADDVPRTLVQADGAGRDPVWYPDGQGVAVRTPDQSPHAVPLRGFRLDGTEDVPPLTPPPVRARIESEQVFIEVAGQRQQVSPPGDRYFRVVVAPDGRHLAYWGLATGVHVHRLADGHHLRLGGGHPRFAGDHLVFERTLDEGAILTGGDLFSVDLTVSHPQVVALTATADRIELVPSRLGDLLVFTTAEGEVWLGRLARRP